MWIYTLLILFLRQNFPHPIIDFYIEARRMDDPRIPPQFFYFYFFVCVWLLQTLEVYNSANYKIKPQYKKLVIFPNCKIWKS